MEGQNLTDQEWLLKYSRATWEIILLINRRSTLEEDGSRTDSETILPSEIRAILAGQDLV